MDFVSHVKVKTIQETVYDRLLKAILCSELAPGNQITLTQLSEQFGVSSMPIREALRRLEAGNFIKIESNKRITVKELSRDELNELLEVRLNLECMAARKAVRNPAGKLAEELGRIMQEVKDAKSGEEFLERNREFHFALYKNANMPLLLETIEYLWRRLSPYLHIYTAQIPNYKTLKIEYHEKILEGVQEGDPEKVCTWLAYDLKKAAELVTGLLNK
jgi:DNA-binding GntR family transcriptional regulator